MFLERVEVNDLTQYPFTKKPFELDQLQNAVRHRMIDIKVKKPDFVNINYFQNEARQHFQKYSVVCDVTILNPEAVLDDRKKTEASVWIHNLQINFYM